MVKLIAPFAGLLGDAALIAWAHAEHALGAISRRPIDLEDAAEQLEAAGLLARPRRGWYFVGPGESHYNPE